MRQAQLAFRHKVEEHDSQGSFTMPSPRLAPTISSNQTPPPDALTSPLTSTSTTQGSTNWMSLMTKSAFSLTVKWTIGSSTGADFNIVVTAQQGLTASQAGCSVSVLYPCLFLPAYFLAVCRDSGTILYSAQPLENLARCSCPPKKMTYGTEPLPTRCHYAPSLACLRKIMLKILLPCVRLSLALSRLPSGRDRVL